MKPDASEAQPRLRGPLVIHFEGPAVARNTLLLRDFLLFGRQIQTALDRVARILQGFTESVQPGRRLSEIEQACSLEVVSFRGGGSANLEVCLPPMKQTVLPTYEDVGEEALRALITGLDELSDVSGKFPRGYDSGVLLSLRDAGKLFDRDIERISFEVRSGQAVRRHVFDRTTVANIVRRIQTPTQNQRTVEGRLLMADFRESGLRCRIHPPLEPPIMCEFEEAQEDTILAAITHFVRVVGEAIETDGKIQVLRIQDVELLDGTGFSGIPGLEGARYESPAPTLDDLVRSGPLLATADVLALAAGIWPQNEDVDEFIESVREWRKEGSVRPLD